MGRHVSDSLKPAVSQFLDHLRVPLYRNGYALVFSSYSTAGLGMVFWMLAAHNYSADVIGLNVAMLSALNFLATLAQLNLMNALNRFVPTSGGATFRFVGYSYLISSIVALFAGLIYIFGVDFWSPSLGALREEPFLALLFTVTVMGWVIFVLQDSVLTGLGQAIWVPVENVFFAVLKLIFLVVLATIIPDYGVLVAWTVALLITLVPVNVLLFRRLIPRHVAKTKHIATTLVPRQIVAYSAGDYLGTLAWRATDTMIPIIIVETVSATANAHYYLSWTIAYSLFSISRSMGMSLITEASAVPSKLGSFSYQTLLQVSRMVIPAVIVLIVGAPYILSLFGSDYSSEGTAVFRLLCLAAVPNIAINLYLSIARIKQQVRKIILVQVTMSVFTLSLAYILLEARGLVGVGIAMLTGQTLIAVALWFTDMRSMWLYRLNIQSLVRLLAFPRKLWWNWRHRDQLRIAYDLIPESLARVPELPGAPPPSTWEPQAVLETVTDVIVIPLGSANQPLHALFKMAHSEEGNASLRQQDAILNALRAEPRLADWHTLFPTILSSDEVDNSFYVVERSLPGRDARFTVSDPQLRERVLSLAVATISEFHQCTATTVIVDHEMSRQWIDEPLQAVRELLTQRGHAAGNLAAIDLLAARLHDALDGRQLPVSWLHGDFVLSNLLVSTDGTQITGILDWDLAAPDELPLLDVLQLLLSTRMLVEKRELGHVVCDLLEGAEWTAFEAGLLDMAQSALPGDSVELQVMILLCWLRHIAAGLKKSSRSAGHWVWVTWNIESVLKCL